MQQKTNNTVICLQMGKTQRQKPHRVIFKSPLPKLHYHHNKWLQVKESQVPYQPTVKPLPQYPIGLVLLWQFLLLMHNSQVRD